MRTTQYIGHALLIFFSCLALSAFAQAPSSFHYQAVLRDASGCAISEANVAIRAGILQGGVGGTLLWEEEHFVSSNEQGAVALQIGVGESTGAGSLATFSEIDWGTDTHFLNVSLDQGEGFVDLGTSQLLSVPYALHAQTANQALNDEVNDADSDPANETISSVSLEGQSLIISEAGSSFETDLSSLSQDSDWLTGPETVYQDSDTVNVGIGTAAPSSKLHVNGSQSVATRLIQETNFENIDENDYLILANANVGELILKLPPVADAIGRIYWIRRIEPLINNPIVISPESGETIDGATSFSLSDNDPESVKIVSTGSQWFVISYSAW